MKWMKLGYYKIREIPNSSVRLGECFAPPAWNVPGSATSSDFIFHIMIEQIYHELILSFIYKYFRKLS